jgi:hypothetical protein
VGLEWGPLSLTSTTEELLGRKNSNSGLEDPRLQLCESAALTDTLYLPKLALTSPTSGSRSVGIVRSWTKAMEFIFGLVFRCIQNFWYHSKPFMPVFSPAFSTQLHLQLVLDISKAMWPQQMEVTLLFGFITITIILEK